jgi:hypothetical protein
MGPRSTPGARRRANHAVPPARRRHGRSVRPVTCLYDTTKSALNRRRNSVDCRPSRANETHKTVSMTVRLPVSPGGHWHHRLIPCALPPMSAPGQRRAGQATGDDQVAGLERAAACGQLPGQPYQAQRRGGRPPRRLPRVRRLPRLPTASKQHVQSLAILPGPAKRAGRRGQVKRSVSVDAMPPGHVLGLPAPRPSEPVMVLLPGSGGKT